MNRDPSIKSRRRPFLAVALAGGAFALAGCGGSAEKPKTVTETVSSSTPASTATYRHTEKFTFDSLGSNLAKGGSNVIYVYKGVKNTAEDKGPQGRAGTYISGQTAVAACIIDGRTVKSVPREDETPRHSNQWLGIETADTVDTYATLVYTRPSEQATLEKLEPCKNAP